MGRWQPDAKGRLQEAAFALFVEQGYDAVAVADIAERAGLTKRTFFNHFTDKREVIFAGADDFAARVLAALASTGTPIDPLRAVVNAYAEAAAPMTGFPELVRTRAAMVASSRELQERDLMKLASLNAQCAETLVQRGVPARHALFVAQAATAIFTSAFSDWSADPEIGLAQALDMALARFRAAVAG